MRVLGRKDVNDLLSVQDAIPLMRKAFEALADDTVSMPSRVFVKADRLGGSIAFMSAFVEPLDAMGMKAIALYPGNPTTQGLPAILGSMLLFAPDSGRTLALMDAGPITSVRTAAVSAIATDYLARADARVAGFIGTGVQARAHVLGLREVRPVRRVVAFSRTPSNREGFARWVSESVGIEAEALPDPRSVVEASDILTTATPSQTPLVSGAWIRPGTHVNVIGSGLATEVDSATYGRASKIVLDQRDAAMSEAHDVFNAIRAGVLRPEGIHGELGELVANRKPGRTAPDEITIFRSLGLAIEDVAMGKHLYDLALRTGRGTDVDFP